MSKKIYNGYIPYDEKNNHRQFTMSKYPDIKLPNSPTYGYAWCTPMHWKYNDPFSAEMTLGSYEKGRSSVNFQFKSTTGNIYYMFMSDFFDMISQYDFISQKISGNWAFRKSGANYGIAYLGP